jgi:hypothetical protein
VIQGFHFRIRFHFMQGEADLVFELPDQKTQPFSIACCAFVMISQAHPQDVR